MSDITDLTAARLSAAIKAKEVSCLEVMRAYLDRIERLNPTYNAIVNLADRQDLEAQALSADEDLAQGHYRGWMHGMPHAVKDLAHVQGFINSQGSPLFAGTVSEHDDIFVERIRKAGAIFIGKTNVPEFGMGSQSYNPVYGVTGSAANPDLTAGGSSGGAGCALGTQMVPCADGSDMMGSLRNPAAFNGVIGFRPTQGRVPKAEANAFMQQLAVEGPMGRDVMDTALLLETMAGFDARAPLSLRDELRQVRGAPDGLLGKTRIAWLGDYNGYLTMEPGVLDICQNALGQLEQEGASIDPVMPAFDMDELWQCWITLRQWAVAGTAAPLLATDELKALIKPEAIWEAEQGVKLTGLDISRAADIRTRWYNYLTSLFETYDVLALPSAQVFPFDKAVHWPEEINGKTMDTYHRWMEVVIGGTLSGCPSVGVPAGTDAQERPMGIQFIAPFGKDAELLEVAFAYENATSGI